MEMNCFFRGIMFSLPLNRVNEREKLQVFSQNYHHFLFPRGILITIKIVLGTPISRISWAGAGGGGILSLRESVFKGSRFTYIP